MKQASACVCTPMVTYKSTIAYDGSGFHGFQRQRDDIRTVQGVLERALQELGWQEQSLLAAGRTDAGVHARGQVVAYTLAWSHSAADLTSALNAHLPRDVAVWESVAAQQGFHPRFDARARQYRYRVITAPVRDPIQERYAWRVWPKPELSVLRACAKSLHGRHDFRAFGRAPIPGGHTRREIFQADWIEVEDALELTIAANAFLHRMVRRMVGAMVDTASDRIGLQDLLALRDHPESRWQGTLAPARGLCLEAVWYGNEHNQRPMKDDSPERETLRLGRRG